MRRFLICAGAHGRPKSLQWLRRVVELRRPDGIFFAGGVLDSASHYAARMAGQRRLSRDDVRFVEHFLETLGELRVFSAIIPGPADVPLEDFLRMGMHAEVEFPAVHLVHATLVEKEDVAVCGMGGRFVGGTAGVLETCSRVLCEYHLRSLCMARQPHKVLLLAGPPTGPLGGSEGSALVADLIDSYHPNLCVVGGLSKRRGTQRIARTLVVNPGHLAEGWAAWLDWDRKAEEQVEWINLRAPEVTSEVIDIGACD